MNKRYHNHEGREACITSGRNLLKAVAAPAQASTVVRTAGRHQAISERDHTGVP